jgi:hypothetical protein
MLTESGDLSPQSHVSVHASQFDAIATPTDSDSLTLVDEWDRNVGYTSKYQAQFDANHAEHEMCSVYIGPCSARLGINWNEILAWRWICPEALQSEMAGAKHFTPWFILEWGRIWRDHRSGLAGAARGVAHLSVPLLQAYRIGRYIAGRKLRGERRYPLVLMLEPLFQCNLACAGCGKIDHPRETLQKRRASRMRCVPSMNAELRWCPFLGVSTLFTRRCRRSFEGTAVNDAFAHPLKALKTMVRGPRVTGPMAPDPRIEYATMNSRTMTSIPINNVKRPSRTPVRDRGAGEVP